MARVILLLTARLSARPPLDDTDEAGATPAGKAKAMGFWSHLEELRWTLIKCAVVFGVFVTIIAYQIDRFAHILNWPLDQARADYPLLKTDLVTNSPMGVFNVVIDICLIGGFVLSLPFMLYFVGQFISPALSQKEKKVLLPTATAASHGTTRKRSRAMRLFTSTNASVSGTIAHANHGTSGAMVTTRGLKPSQISGT